MALLLFTCISSVLVIVAGHLRVQSKSSGFAALDTFKQEERLNSSTFLDMRHSRSKVEPAKNHSNASNEKLTDEAGGKENNKTKPERASYQSDPFFETPTARWLRTGSAAQVVLDFAANSTSISSAPAALTHERFAQDIKIEDIAPDFSDCKLFFIDAGSNIGVHIRILFEGQHYQKSKYQAVFTETFGDSAWRSKRSNETGLCAIGIEASPVQENRLKKLETCYRARGWHVKFLTPAALSAKGHELVKFFVNNRSSISSNLYNHGGGTEVHVPTVDLSEVVQKVLDGRGEKGKVVVKMDIEGAEFEVFPRLNEQGCLCNERIGKMTVEWHPEKVKDLFPEQHVKTTIERYTKNFVSPACPNSTSTILGLDDESYGDDAEYPLDKICQ